MTNFDLDGKSIMSITTFHLVVAEQGGFPSYYGKNFDAFWDCMTTDVEGPITFTWKNHKLSMESMGKDFDTIILLLENISTERGDLTINLC